MQQQITKFSGCDVVGNVSAICRILWTEKVSGYPSRRFESGHPELTIWPGATSPPRFCGLPSPAPGHLFNHNRHQPRERYHVVMATRHKAHPVEHMSEAGPLASAGRYAQRG